MFSRTATSKIIALKFTLYVFLILVFFAMVANTLFLRQWLRAENKRLLPPPAQTITAHDIADIDSIPTAEIHGFIASPFGTPQVLITRPMRRGGAGASHSSITPRTQHDTAQAKFIRTQGESLPYSTGLAKLLIDNRVLSNISKIDDEYVLFARDGDIFHIAVVTRPVEAQQAIARLSLIGILLSTVLTYLISHYFVKSSLGRLSRLTQSVEKLNFDNLDTQIPLEGPSHDEIRIIASALQDSLTKINTQKKALHDFVAHASHELKTPLMSIGSQIDYLIKSQPSHDTGLDKIKSTTKSMNSLIEQLLTLAKLDATESGAHDITPINASHELNEYIAHRPQTSKAITLQTDITSDVMLTVRPSDRHNLINNLIDNAYKYTDSGTISITLTPTSFRVSDTGRGISAHDLPHIREKFRQADTSKTDRQSVGLGLSLVKSITRRYNRTITTRSTPNEGTEFTIRFTP